MGFMEPEIQEGDWFSIDGPCGGEHIPADLVSLDIPEKITEEWLEDVALPALHDFIENRKLWTVEKIHGFGARLSAPGYMDCTEWTVFDTEEEAKDHIREFYDVCPDCDAEISESGCDCEEGA